MSEICAGLHRLFNSLERHSFKFDESRIPKNGIYVIFEKGEKAHNGDRIVRVGTHRGSNRLLPRLDTLFVKENKNINIFRKNIGQAFLFRDGDSFLEQWNWDMIPRKNREKYDPLVDWDKLRETEQRVSEYIHNNLSFAVFKVEDEAQRLRLEKQLIGTISSCDVCSPSPLWLGLHSSIERIRESGLWLVQLLYKNILSPDEYLEIERLITQNSGNANSINHLFDRLDEWRHLSAYQLERRADIFFSLYLGDLLRSKYSVEIESILPEFPVRIGTISSEVDTNQSFKIDYLALAKDNNRVFFVELKTDKGSRRSKQDRYLQRSKEVGLVELLRGLLIIYQATSSKKKYQLLLHKLCEMGLVDIETDGSFSVIPDTYDIKIVYLQPNVGDEFEDVISFDEAAEAIEKIGDLMSKRFAQSLRNWASVEAGEM